VNNTGAIVGWTGLGDGGFLLLPGAPVRNLPAGMIPNSINVAGTVAGTVYSLDGCDFNFPPCVYAALWSVDSGIATLSPEAASAVDINDRGAVVGDRAAIGGLQPYRWSASRGSEDLPTFGPISVGEDKVWVSEGVAAAINNWGEAVGTVYAGFAHAVLWTASGERLLLSTEDSFAHDLNDSGWVVGEKRVDGKMRATLWRVGGLARP
jgi:hypothetical protein